MYGSPPLAAAAADSLVRFGRRTRPYETNPTVTVSITRIVNNNPNRVELTMVNLGTQLVYFSTGNGPSATNGYFLVPQGGVTLLVEEDGEQVAYDWFAVAASGTQQMFVSEVLAD